MLAIFILPLVGAILVTVLGAIWYGPLFGKQYMSAMGMTMPVDMAAAKKDMMIRMAIDFVMSFVMFFGFLTILNLSYAGTYKAALVIGALFWFFFVMTQKASGAIWSGRDRKNSWMLFGLNAGYSLVSFLLVGPLFIFLIRFFV
jgi:glycerol uptake facilitator-like aquaporin